MSEFTVNYQLCQRCGKCADDCPMRLIGMTDEGACFIQGREMFCYKCQHCLAVCPHGAVSVMGRNPVSSCQLAGNYPTPGQMETLIKGRRSFRHYKVENLGHELLQRLLDVASHAPSGCNSRQVCFTVVDDYQKLILLRTEIMDGLTYLFRQWGASLPQKYADYKNCLTLWNEKGVDILFNGAPHLLIASAPWDLPSPSADCFIALSYFELFAQVNGVGTVWSGLVKDAVNDLLPETRVRLGIPKDHLVGYAMAFGWPAVQYTRTVQHSPAKIIRFLG